MSLQDIDWKIAYRPKDELLESFYIPALSNSVRYDRIAGFFSSSALAVAAQGVAEFIQSGGTMRLLVGAKLSPVDVEAINSGNNSLKDSLVESFHGLLDDPAALVDTIQSERLKILAWLVANDRLVIRVVVKEDITGCLESEDGYFHAKGGILSDSEGNAIAFSGSINESAQAWLKNYENFHVFCSWEDKDIDRLEEESDAFEQIWNGTEEGWRTVHFPDAVKQRLIDMAGEEPPLTDPLARTGGGVDERVRWFARYLSDAPHLINYGWLVGVETAPVEPYPNQRRVAYEVLNHFPCRRLLADEVGLGKTIEAGLILRSAILSGMVKRSLIVVPASLLRQWQEELRDSFRLEVPIFTGNRYLFYDKMGKRKEYDVPKGKTPWNTYPAVLVSAQMYRREDRRREVLEAGTWDLVIADEAHHARRHDFLDKTRYRPNLLLQLLLQLKDKSRAMLLLTATPMQVDILEVFDLFQLLDPPGQWGVDQTEFTSYFEQAGLPVKDVAWHQVLPLLNDIREANGGWDEHWIASAQDGLGFVDFQELVNCMESGGKSDIVRLTPIQQEWLRKAVHVHNPIQQLMFRHTRSLLRKYYKAGLLKNPIPRREPTPKWIKLDKEAHRLYTDIERYLSEFYRRYEEDRRGLGFVMTVYRRRLTSSFFALAESFQRKLEFLQGKADTLGLTNEDTEEYTLFDDKDFTSDRPKLATVKEEIDRVEQLLTRIGQMEEEPKFTQLKEDLSIFLLGHDQVIVFTQYTDTMKYLRANLKSVYGSKLACYSGEGGELYEPDTDCWRGLSKDRVQQRFSEGEIKVLLCTEAGAEGLNLQSCAVIINYDMPWNPMRVEQRIGRVDRIGQKKPSVQIRHYFYEDTVELLVYQALATRIEWFEAVVGRLQPILQQTENLIKEVAMMDPDTREALVKERIKSFEDEIDEAVKRGDQVYEDDDESDVIPDVVRPEGMVPVTRQLLGSLIKQSDPQQLRNPWGEGVKEMTLPQKRSDIRRMEDPDSGYLGYYHWTGTEWEIISDMASLDDALGKEPSVPDSDDQSVEDDFTLRVNQKPQLFPR